MALCVLLSRNLFRFHKKSILNQLIFGLDIPKLFDKVKQWSVWVCLNSKMYCSIDEKQLKKWRSQIHGQSIVLKQLIIFLFSFWISFKSNQVNILQTKKIFFAKNILLPYIIPWEGFKVLLLQVIWWIIVINFFNI